MADKKRNRWSWLPVVIVVATAGVLFYDVGPVGASEDHEDVRELRESGAILPLSELLARPDLQGLRVLEAEIEREHGRLVYELELLDESGRVRERYFDAASGEPLNDKGDR